MAIQISHVHWTQNLNIVIAQQYISCPVAGRTEAGNTQANCNNCDLELNQTTNSINIHVTI